MSTTTITASNAGVTELAGNVQIDNKGVNATHMAPVKKVAASVVDEMRKRFFAKQKIAAADEKGYTFNFPVTYFPVEELFLRGAIASVNLEWTNESKVTVSTVFTKETIKSEICTDQVKNMGAVGLNSIYSLFPKGVNSTMPNYGPCMLDSSNAPCSVYEGNRKDVSLCENAEKYKSVLLCCAKVDVDTDFPYESSDGSVKTRLCCGSAKSTVDTPNPDQNKGCDFKFKLPYGWMENSRTFSENLNTDSWPVKIIKLTNSEYANHVPAFTDPMICKTIATFLATPVGLKPEDAAGDALIDKLITCKPYKTEDGQTTYYVIEMNNGISTADWLGIDEAVQSRTIQNPTFKKPTTETDPAPPADTDPPPNTDPPPKEKDDDEWTFSYFYKKFLQKDDDDKTTPKTEKEKEEEKANENFYMMLSFSASSACVAFAMFAMLMCFALMK